MKINHLAGLSASAALTLCLSSPAQAVISRTGQAFGRYGSGNTIIDEASFPGGQLGPNDGTYYQGVSNANIDVGAVGQIIESMGVLSAAAGFTASSAQPDDPLKYFIASGGGATLIQTIDVTSTTLPQFTPVQVRFALGVGYELDATHSFGAPGSTDNNAFASASVQVNVTGLNNVFFGANDNKVIKNTQDGTGLAVGLFAGSLESEFVINSEVGGSITFALVVDADANGDVSGDANPLVNYEANAYATVAVAYGAGPANGEDIQLTTTDPADDFSGLQYANHAHAATNMPNNPFTPLAGDLNNDGFVGLADLDLVLSNWNQNVTPGESSGDPSGDGFVGLEDLDTVLTNWNAGTPPASANNFVPEPATATLLLLTGFCLAGARSQRVR